MNKAMALASGIGIGAGLMYFYDPDRGHRRRVLVKDKAVSAVKDVDDAINKTSRDLKNRARGVAAEAFSVFSLEEVPDEILEARVASRIGRLVSHPHAIEISVANGEVTLQGAVLSGEAPRLIRGVSAMRGVTHVHNRLEAHTSAEDIPVLHGGYRRSGQRLDVLQAKWSPATRLVMGAAGLALTLYGMKHRNLLGLGASAVGAGLMARGLSNRELTHPLRLERAA